MAAPWSSHTSGVRSSQNGGTQGLRASRLPPG